MRYYLLTKQGPLANEQGKVVYFNSYSDARHWAINHWDLSTYIEIVREGLKI